MLFCFFSWKFFREHNVVCLFDRKNWEVFVSLMEIKLILPFFFFFGKISHDTKLKKQNKNPAWTLLLNLIVRSESYYNGKWGKMPCQKWRSTLK